MNTITVVVNGEPRSLPDPANLADLLTQLHLDPRLVVVELNRRIVRRPSLAEASLHEGDHVELVHFVGGG